MSTAFPFAFPITLVGGVMAGYTNRYITVGTTPTAVFTVTTGGGVVLQNNSDATTVYLGGPTVTATGVGKGFALRPDTPVFIPTVAGTTNTVYGVVASSTALVGALYAV